MRELDPDKTMLFERAQPTFQDGEEISPSSLNRIAEFAQALRQELLKNLAPEGGILRYVGQELSASSRDQSLTVSVGPGAAITGNGTLLILEKTAQISLERARPILQNEQKTIFLYLVSKRRKEKSEEDPLYEEIQKDVAFCEHAEVLLSEKALVQDDTVEIARVDLAQSTEALQGSTSTSPEPTPGELQLGHRRYVQSLAGCSLTGAEQNRYLDACDRARSFSERAAAAYHLDPPWITLAQIISLKSEIRRDCLSPRTVIDLVHELNEQLALQLENARRVFATQKSDISLEKVESVLEKFRQIRKGKPGPREILDRFFVTIQEANKALFGGGDASHEILEYFRATRLDAFSYSETIAPGGNVLQRSDRVLVSEIQDRAQVDSSKQERLRISAQLRGGQRQSADCLAIRGGSLTLHSDHLLAGKDLWIVGQVYKRRQELSIRFECNGQTVHTEETTPADPADHLITYAFRVSASVLTNKSNQLRIIPERYETTFPFLGVSFYQ